jgi:hydrogenase/urease accessory protein HupE
MKRLCASLAAALLALAPAARAHETRPAYLELRQRADERFEMHWKVPALGEMRLALDPRFPADCVSEGEPLRYFTDGAFVEKRVLHRVGGLDGQPITIAGLAATKTDVLVRIVRRNGAVQTERLTPAAPTFVVAAVPSALAAARSYAWIGFEHILLGADHLLFVLGLLLIVRGRRALFWTITSFTLAHSVTLALATLGVARAPLQPLNAAIALSILFLGPEIVRAWRGQTSLSLRHPWLVAFAFGLLHGFGFASGLSTLGLARAEVAQGLVWFNVGVELGQLAFVALLLALARSFRVLELRWPLWLARAPGYAVGACGAFWTIQRVLPLFHP